MTTLPHREQPHVATIDERRSSIVATRTGLPCRIIAGRVTVAQEGKSTLSTQPLFTQSFDSLRLVENELTADEAREYNEEITNICDGLSAYYFDLTPTDRAELLLGILEGGAA